jgi:formylglycine-generating enzyme required for sulfatase activity
LLAEIDDPGTEPPRRLEIGDELARLGDPRPGVGLRPDGLPDIDWVEIPEGAFIFQEGETRELPTFWMARYPVTNAQYQAFIDDGGYRKSGFWKDLQRPKRKASTWPQPNRPRTDVDWYEAVAFTRWLNARLGLPEGSIRLPTELEWEKATRGEHGSAYPWGGEYRSGYANVNERTFDEGKWYLEQTTAVGLYPHGRSPYGVDDLAGNVWEWCLNKDEDLKAIAPDASRNSRALRGGSWYVNPDYARAGHRYRFPPDYQYYFRGFRVLSSVPIGPVR